MCASIMTYVLALRVWQLQSYSHDHNPVMFQQHNGQVVTHTCTL